MNATTEAAARLPWTTQWRSYWEADRGRLLHAVKTALALVVAMGVCMRLQLTPPRTAMVTVVILMMHQHAGMVIARGFYRGVGMAAGSVAGLVLVAAFPQQPVPFFLALAVWVGLCVVGAAYYRNYQSYGFVLAGYATAITAVPAWSNPHGVFDSVVHALSEVTVGVVVASLVSALLLPQHVGKALYLAGQRHCSSFLGFIRQALRGEVSDAALDTVHLKLVGERAQLEGLRSAAVFEDPELRLSNPLMARLSHDFLDAAAGFHVMRQVHARAAKQGDEQALTAIDDLFGELLAVLPDGGNGGMLPLEDIRAARARLQALLPLLSQRIEARRDALGAADEATQRRFATAASAMYFAAADLESYLENFLAVRDRPVDYAPSASGKVHIRRIISTANRIAATAAGIRAMLAVLIVAAAWVASGWQGGASAVVAVAITCALFAVMPQPAVASRQIFLGCLAGWLVAFVFDYFLLPKLDGFLLLAVCIAPVIMVGSYINTFPQTAILGLGFNIYFCFIGNITNPSVFTPLVLLDTGFAMLAGIAVAALAFSVIVPYAGEWATSSYLRQIRRLVTRMACAAPLEPDLLVRFESNMRDFIIQVAARPLEGAVGRRSLLGWAFSSLEIGRAAIQLREDAQRHPEELPADWPQRQRDWQFAIAALFDGVTPQRYHAALDATRRALEALPVPRFDPALVRLRMRAHLHATELSLLDDSLPLHPVYGGRP